MLSLLQNSIRKWGVRVVTAITTLISVLFSILITYLINLVTGNEDVGDGLWIAALVPLIVAPVFSYWGFQLIHRLDKAEQELRILAQHDPLTALYNRRHFVELVEKYIHETVGSSRHLALVMIDVDFFKNVNDRFGHMVGDQTLHHLAELLRDSVRASDYVGRFGGDEFVLFLPGITEKEAMAVVERIRKDIGELSLPIKDHHIDLTLSIGVFLADEYESVDDLLRGADEAMYRAKEQGRNQVVIKGMDFKKGTV